MKTFIVTAMLAFAGASFAGTTLDFNRTPIACGDKVSGRCTVYSDAVQTVSLYWASGGNVQVSIYNSAGLLVDTYTGNVGGDPKAGFTNAVLTDVLGNAISVTAAMHHNVTYRTFVYHNYVDSGSITE